MHGKGEIASVKSAKLTRSVQKSFSSSDDEATDTNQETRTTRLEGNFNTSSEENIHSYANNWQCSRLVAQILRNSPTQKSLKLKAI